MKGGEGGARERERCTERQMERGKRDRERESALKTENLLLL